MRALNRHALSRAAFTRHVFFPAAATKSADPFQTITEQKEEVVSKLAIALECRAAEPAQIALRSELLGSLSGAVLEVGTGTGAVARTVAANPAVSSVVGIDPSKTFLEKACALGGPKEKYVEAYSTDLTGAVAAESIDHALLWLTLGHIPREAHEATFRELHRILKPGGTLHVFDNDPCSWDFRMHPHDPLNAPVQALIDFFAEDRHLMRRVPTALGSHGFLAQPLRIHTILDTSAESYGYKFVMLRALEMFREIAGPKIVGAPLIDAMKMEALRRVNAGEFQMALSYAYIRAERARQPVGAARVPLRGE